MEPEPAKIVNTPIKRLGTGRMRSAQISPCNMSKVNLAQINTPTSAKTLKRNFPGELNDRDENTALTPSKMLKSLADILPTNTAPTLEPSTEREKYLNELEKKLESVSDFSELETAVALWRAGCKQALLELQSWLSDKEDVKMSVKTLAGKLGIWTVVKEHFDGDSEIICSDDDSENPSFQRSSNF